mmetsp:Transcript_34584/g.97529  ORF Transcript_34584/g.97529 Transcript_34584/m.97529 type:complete len:174 (+) Transcript_34584:418-939(+)
MIHVVPLRWLISRRRSIISIVFLVSKSPVGSSRSRISGSFARARAMVTRCCSPPDNSEGRCFIRSRSPTAVRRDLVRARASPPVSLLRMVMGSSTFSYADMVERRLNVWNTNPILPNLSCARNSSSDSAWISSPSSCTMPVVGVSMVPRMLSSDVLPPPLGPRSITNSPLRTG